MNFRKIIKHLLTKITSRLLKILKISLSTYDIEQLETWQNVHKFREPYPYFVKKNVFDDHNLDNAIWVETGTHVGETTEYLSNISKFVYSIEPSKKYFEISKEKLKNIENIQLFNDTSEGCLKEIINLINDNENVCFWLDGHYSGGDTYQGDKDTPILDELNVIADALEKFNKVSILIDDFRMFNPDLYKGYPDKGSLIEWSEKNGFKWTSTRDILIFESI